MIVSEVLVHFLILWGPPNTAEKGIHLWKVFVCGVGHRTETKHSIIRQVHALEIDANTPHAWKFGLVLLRVHKVGKW